MVEIAIGRERALAEIQRRHRAILDLVTPLNLASGTARGKTVVHEWCLKVLTSTAKNLCLVCSRRAGKTYAICCLLLLTALTGQNTNSLYLGLTSKPAKKVFGRIWKRLLAKFKIGETLATHSETDLVTTFYNGSTVTFGGVDDLRHVQSLLGESMAGGVAVVDESQSGASSVLRSLAEDVLGPMLDETNDEHPFPGRLVVAGTQPKVRAGYLHDVYQPLKDGTSTVWDYLRWSRFQNPFLTDNDSRLAEHLETYGLRITDIIIRANWFGEDVYDEGATAFGYRDDRNQWVGQPSTWTLPEHLWAPDGQSDKGIPTKGYYTFTLPPAGFDQFVACLDPAALSDRCAIVLWGWDSKNPQGIRQIGEWVTGKAANAVESTYFGVLSLLCQHYKIVAIVKDAGSDSTTQDPAFLSEYGLVIEPAKKGKGSKKARVDRLRDLLMRGRAKVLKGSQLEQDLKLARFDPDARAEGKYEWTSDCHPDVADAATYGIPRYIESITVTRKSPEQVEAEIERNSWNQASPEYGPVDVDPGTAGFNDDTGYGGGFN